MMVRADTIGLHLAKIAAAIRLSSKLVTTACTTAAVTTTGAIGVECTITSGGRDADVSAHYHRLLNPAAWHIINSTFLTGEQPFLVGITARTTMTPEVAMPRCDLDPFQTSASCRITVPHDRIRLIVQNSVAATSATIYFAHHATGNHRTDTQRFECTMIAFAGPAGCTVSTCDIPLSGPAGTIANITDIVYAPSDLLASTCGDVMVGLAAQVSFGNGNTTTSTTVRNDLGDFATWLVFGLVLIALSVGGWAVAVSMIVLSRRQQQRFQRELYSTDAKRDALSTHSGTTGIALEPGPDREATPQPNISDWASMKGMLLIRLRLIADQPRASQGFAMRFHLWAPALGVVGCGLAVCGLLCVVYFVTAFDQRSNFRVMYEEYTDDQCERSATAYMPRRIFAVPAGSWECERMQSTGEAVGATFATGTCEGTSGSYAVHFAMGPSQSSCRHALRFVIPSGMCVPIQELIPNSGRNVFVKLTCSTSEQILSRTTILRQLTTTPDVFVRGEASTPASRLTSATPTEDGPIRVPYLVGGAIGFSTSASPNTVASVAMSRLPSNLEESAVNPLSVIVQSTTCTFTTASNSHCNQVVDALQQSRFADTTPYLPLMPNGLDAPIGQLFNGYGTTDAVTWASGGIGAHRYYRIQGGPFDIGKHFPEMRDDPQDEDGYAISMWLRAGPDTVGFAYAVTDAFEDVTTSQVHTLDRLATIIESGSGGHAWYNDTYQVYHSLYVNGPGRSLTFAFAGPSLPGRVQQIDYDLREIGAEHLFNDQWHHVVVSFEVENGKIRAQLMVDGETSYTKAGWGVCTSDVPLQMAAVPVDADGRVVLHNRVGDRVLRAGLLVVGYLNGGVSNLRAHTERVVSTDFLRAGTQVMRDRSPFLLKETSILGAVLLLLGSFLLLFGVVLSVRDLRSTFSSSSAGQYWHTANRFYLHQRHAAQLRRNTGALPLRPVRLPTALRWVGLSPHDFSVVMDEVEAQCEDPSVAILLLIFQIKMDNPNIKRINPGTWNAFEDARVSDMHADIKQLGCDRDLFADVFKWSATPSDGFTNLADEDGDDVEHVKSNDREGGAPLEGTIGVPTKLNAGGRDARDNAAPTMAPSAPSEAPGTISTLGGIVVSAVATFQGMYVWSTSISLPNVYVADFGKLFSFVSVDFATLFPGIPTLLTPMIQVVVGMVCVALVVFFMFNDNSEFEGMLARYVWRRDDLEHPALHQQLLSHPLPPAFTSLLANPLEPNSPTYVRALAVKDSMAVDKFVEQQKNSKASGQHANDAEVLDRENTHPPAPNRGVALHQPTSVLRRHRQYPLWLRAWH